MLVTQEMTDILTANLQFYKEKLKNSEIINQLAPSNLSDLRQLIKNEIQVVEDIFEFRIKRVQEMENPYLPPVVHTEYYFIEKDPMTVPITELIDHLLQIKESVLKYIILIHPSRLNRTGYHWQEGHITLEQLIQRYIKNDQIFAEELKSLLSF